MRIDRVWVTSDRTDDTYIPTIQIGDDLVIPLPGTLALNYARAVLRVAAFITLNDDKPFCEWTLADAQQHAMYVLDASVVSDLLPHWRADSAAQQPWRSKRYTGDGRR